MRIPTVEEFPESYSSGIPRSVWGGPPAAAAALDLVALGDQWLDGPRTDLERRDALIVTLRLLVDSYFYACSQRRAVFELLRCDDLLFLHVHRVWWRLTHAGPSGFACSAAIDPRDGDGWETAVARGGIPSMSLAEYR